MIYYHILDYLVGQATKETKMRAYLYNTEEAKIKIDKRCGRFVLATDLETKETVLINAQSAPIFHEGKLVMFNVSGSESEGFEKFLKKPVELGLNAYGVEALDADKEDETIFGTLETVTENKIVVSGKSIPKAGIDYLYPGEAEEETDEDDEDGPEMVDGQ